MLEAGKLILQYSLSAGVSMKVHLIAALAVLAPAALAQAPLPPLRCEDKVHRQFDFWLGEWEVFNSKGEKVGENSVASAEKGCLVIERWASTRGVTGQSYNFYDTQKKQWRQVWVSPHELSDYAGGLNAKGEMEMEALTQQAGGGTQKTRGIWTANPDGTVRQVFWYWDEEKKAWVEDFVGVYRRKK
jgi:hypothetical protein